MTWYGELYGRAWVVPQDPAGTVMVGEKPGILVAYVTIAPVMSP